MFLNNIGNPFAYIHTIYERRMEEISKEKLFRSKTVEEGGVDPHFESKMKEHLERRMKESGCIPDPEFSWRKK
jgi:hypothetical protein